MTNMYGARGVTTLLSAMSAVVLLSLFACARGTPPARSQTSPTVLVAHPADTPTVFTDSALFRVMCVEADSGLTARGRRCTPRDQSLLLFRRKP
jgi:hypothetical protein